MGIDVLSVIDALASVATKAWGAYVQTRDSAESSRRNGEQMKAHQVRVQRLEEASLEQARLVSELSRDLEQFAKAIQGEIEETNRRLARTSWVLYLILAISLTALVLAIIVLLR